MRRKFLFVVMVAVALSVLLLLGGCSSNKEKVVTLETTSNGQLAEGSDEGKDVPAENSAGSSGSDAAQTQEPKQLTSPNNSAQSADDSANSSSSDQEVIYEATDPNADAQVGTAGDKTITVVVTGKDGVPVTKTVRTSAGDLLTALKEAQLASDDDPENPGYITTVNGYTADTGNYEWWAVSKGGVGLAKSANQTPISDGESYEFVLQSGLGTE